DVAAGTEIIRAHVLPPCEACSAASSRLTMLPFAEWYDAITLACVPRVSITRVHSRDSSRCRGDLSRPASIETKRPSAEPSPTTSVFPNVVGPIHRQPAEAAGEAPRRL